jgi:hypothetical protein
MRDFTNIPPWSPCPWEHEERDSLTDRMIMRAANLLNHLSETETLDKLVSEFCVPLEKAVNAVRAGAILNEHRAPVATQR